MSNICWSNEFGFKFLNICSKFKHTGELPFSIRKKLLKFCFLLGGNRKTSLCFAGEYLPFRIFRIRTSLQFKKLFILFDVKPRTSVRNTFLSYGLLTVSQQHCDGLFRLQNVLAIRISALVSINFMCPCHSWESHTCSLVPVQDHHKEMRQSLISWLSFPPDSTQVEIPLFNSVI